MKPLKIPLNFNDLLIRLDEQEDSAVGSAFNKFGSSVSDTMKKAYNLTADPIGLGAKSDDKKTTQTSPEDIKIFQQLGIRQDEWDLFHSISETYFTNPVYKKELLNKVLLLPKGEKITFNFDPWYNKQKITKETLSINKSSVFFNNDKSFQDFFTNFTRFDFTKLPLDNVFISRLEEIIDSYIMSVTDPQTAKLLNKNTLKTNMLNYIKKLKLSNKIGTYKDFVLYYKVFYVFVSIKSNSQIF